tara:strand:+ start:777 stop:1082 length:306 start_codon:yes stop_codon:yes gene_type:complete
MKEKRIQSRKHQEFVCSLDCCIKDISCQGPIQAHHLLKPWVGSRGIGMRSDDRNVIPLCFYHHAQLHTKYGNEERFFERYFRSRNYGRKLAKSLWKKNNEN